MKILPLILLSLLGVAAAAQQTPTPPTDPLPPYVPVRVGMRIFVSGNNEVGVNLRRTLISSECFVVVQNPKQAEAILDAAEEEAASGAQGTWTTYGSATLTDTNGNLLFADSKQGIPGMLHSGAGNAATNLAESLYLNAGCKLNGKRK